MSFVYSGFKANSCDQVYFGRSMNEERLFKARPFFRFMMVQLYECVSQSANYVRVELPIRIAHRLRELQALPYVVVTQEGVAKVYEVRIHPDSLYILRY
jgi:pyruvate dehydrogenase kinase 2/3/4